MQMKLLRDLLVNGTVKLTVEKMIECSIGYRDYLELEKFKVVCRSARNIFTVLLFYGKMSSFVSAFLF
jgi:hypothetical protein